MPKDIVIGKYAIESLTTGMYTDPFVIYREYIQNATDAIDDAIHQSIIEAKDGAIKVMIDDKNHRIVIEDNGIGLSQENAYRFLSDIGNSHKVQGSARGFRGIGRFSGLSYCDRLIFTTTSKGDAVSYSIEYDAKRLREIIAKDVNTITAEEAIVHSITEKHDKVNTDAHFFRVTMENVHSETGLLDIGKVEQYLSMVAPVKFGNDFSWGNEIANTVCNQLGPISTYKLTLVSREQVEEISKLYTDTFLLNRTTGVTDQIKKICYFPIRGVNGEQVGLAWYGISSFYGTIIGNEIKSLRLRIGNILIGDHTALNGIFKDPRFNGWVVGEVYVTSPDFVPNARRDGFENNTAYYSLMEQLRQLAALIVKDIRTASAERSKTIENAAKVHQTTDDVLNGDRISDNAREKGKRDIKQARAEVLNSSEEMPEELKMDVLEQMDILSGRVVGASSFKAINLLPNLTKNEREFLDGLFRKLKAKRKEKEAEKVIDTILEVLS